MPKSMTGYGRSRVETDAYTQVWEIRSVNGRFLDIKWRLPLFLRRREARLEKVVREYAKRGRVDITLNFQPTRAEAVNVELNRPLAKSMLDQMAALAREAGLDHRPDLNRMMAVPALWREETGDLDAGLAAALEDGLRLALADFSAAREREGAELKADIAKRVERMLAWHGRLKELAPSIKEERVAALNARIQAVLEKAGVEAAEERIIQEAAILCDKLDVTEELTRLSGHLERILRLLDRGGELGKRLDFLIQETFREINTCGNKAQSLDAGRVVVDFKGELEKCREQAQNIE